MKSLIYPLATEKTLNMIERDNVISYVVDMRSNKTEIRKEFESMFNVKVMSINTERSIKNFKKAYIKLGKNYRASDVARKLKLV